MSSLRPLVIERLRHVPGELLRSRDLRDQLAADVELQWWHQRAVHDAAGVVAGLVAHIEGESVTVTPGLAYDPRGRELLLAQTATIERPASGVVLVLRRCERHAPELAWVAPAQLQRCDGVSLARWNPKDGGLEPAYGTRARSLARPRFASGATLAGATDWAPWLELWRTAHALGIEVRVNTRTAGFTGHPCYFASLQWPRADSPDAVPAAFGFGLQHLAEETAEAFTFRVVLLSSPRAVDVRGRRLLEANGLTTYARTQRLSVTWVGLEDDNDRGGSA